MKEKIRVGLLLGGQSVEHEISILSARNVYEAMDRNKYEIFLIGIDKEGRWHFSDERIFLENGMKTRLKSLPDDGNFLVLVPGGERQSTFSLYHTRGNMPVDVIFPVLHGTHGEDGTVQGFLTLAGIPFVGAGILGSAIGMDKEVTKRLLRDAGIPTPHFRVFHPRDLPKMDFAALGEETYKEAYKLANQLHLQGIRAELDYEGKSLKSQMRRANKLKARYALILGEEELKSGKAALRDMEGKSQEDVLLNDILNVLKRKIERD
ncbi:MAG: His/Gly/Thr/Pro-type tRNA ligase C-terminal domain-containing protein [Atribacterota bacterium]